MDSAALAILLGQGISSAGQIYANQSNIANQRWANNINWAINAANNATQIDMANSAHQREVADLKAAGLNPILSAGGHGLAVPTLAGGDQRSTNIENPADGAASSASQLARYMARDYKAQVEQAEANVAATRANTKQTELDTRLADAQFAADWREAAVRSISADFELDALAAAYGRGLEIHPNGVVYTDDEAGNDRYNKMINLRAEALEAEAADASNLNWRNNLKAIGGTATDLGGVLNSAGGLMRHLRSFNNMRRLSNILNRYKATPTDWR